MGGKRFVEGEEDMGNYKEANQIKKKLIAATKI